LLGNGSTHVQKDNQQFRMSLLNSGDYLVPVDQISYRIFGIHFQVNWHEVIVARVMDSMASEVHDNVSAIEQTNYRLIKVEKEKQLGPFWNLLG